LKTGASKQAFFGQFLSKILQFLNQHIFIFVDFTHFWLNSFDGFVQILLTTNLLGSG